MINSLLNPTNNPWAGEQNLLQDMVDESIQIIGIEMSYLIREKLSRDFLFGESPISDFKEAVTIEMEIVDIEKFNGDGDMYTVFGIEHTDTATFRVSQRRFKTEFDDQPNVTMPREGDLLFLAPNNSLWEIRRVNFDENYQRFGISYSYLLKCNLFQFSFENIDTGIEEVDSFDSKFMDIESEETFGGLLQTLTVKQDNFNEESKQIKTKASMIKTFDPLNPFD